MKRFAAVLAVLFVANPVWATGWYLMLPPARTGRVLYATSLTDLFTSVDTDAPFDSWKTFSSFDSADACNSEKMNQLHLAMKFGLDAMRKASPDFLSLSEGDRILIANQRRHAGALCVISDDPRLLAVSARKQWRLISPPRFERSQKSLRYVDELLDKNSPVTRWDVVSSHSSEWDCEAQKEFELLRFLNSYHLKRVDRSQLDLTRLDLKSKKGTDFLGYVLVRDAQCVANDDPRLK